jgi:hypothetical protein
MTNSILLDLERKLKQRDELTKLVANLLLFFDRMKLPGHVEAQMDFYRRQYDGILNRIDEIPG